MMNRNSRIIAVTLALGLLLDIATKWLVQTRFQLHESVQLFPGVALTYVMNPGAAFSLFASWPAEYRLPMFIAVTLAALVAAWFYQKDLPAADWLSALGLGLVASGAIGNLIDRIRFGEVVDFVEVGVRGVYTWPVFNVADSCVCVGVGILIFRSFKPLQASHAPDPS